MPSRIVEQHFQEMLGKKLLMALAERKSLGGLNEALRPLGVFFESMALNPFGPLDDPKHRPDVLSLKLAPKGAFSRNMVRSFERTIAPRKAHIPFLRTPRIDIRYVRRTLTITARSDPSARLTPPNDRGPLVTI